VLSIDRPISGLQQHFIPADAFLGRSLLINIFGLHTIYDKCILDASANAVYLLILAHDMFQGKIAVQMKRVQFNP